MSSHRKDQEFVYNQGTFGQANVSAPRRNKEMTAIAFLATFIKDAVALALSFLVSKKHVNMNRSFAVTPTSPCGTTQPPQCSNLMLDEEELLLWMTKADKQFIEIKEELATERAERKEEVASLRDRVEVLEHQLELAADAERFWAQLSEMEL